MKTGTKRVVRALALAGTVWFCYTHTVVKELPPKVYASTQNEDEIKRIQNQISNSRDERSKLAAEKSDLEKLRDNLKKSKDDLTNYVRQIDNSISDLQLKINELQGQAEEKRREIEAAEADLAEAERIRDEQYAMMKERIRFMYEMGNKLTVDVLVDASTFPDMLNKAQHIAQLAEYDRNKLDEYKSAVERVELIKSALEEEKLTLEEIISTTEAEEANLQALSEEKTNEIYGLNRDIADQQAAIEEYERQIREADAEIAAMETELRKLKINYVYNGEPFLWPAPSATALTSPFGYRNHPIYRRRQLHTGVDMAAPGGSPIVAVADGYVLRAGWQSSMGNYVMLAHSDELVTIYMHASALYVKAGDTVSAGATIAAVGSTGDSTGNHLHFTVRVNGQYVEPLEWLPTWTGPKYF